MARVLYTAFDIIPGPQGTSTHILHNIRGLVNSQYPVHLMTPKDGLLPPRDAVEGARLTRLLQNFFSTCGSLCKSRARPSYSASRLRCRAVSQYLGWTLDRATHKMLQL
jgi:hypothetical protein